MGPYSFVGYLLPFQTYFILDVFQDDILALHVQVAVHTFTYTYLR
jgi:hypothetical protein